MVEQLVLGVNYMFLLLPGIVLRGEVVSKTSNEVTIKISTGRIFTLNEAHIVLFS